MNIIYDQNNPKSSAHADEVVKITSAGVDSKIKLEGNKITSIDAAQSKIILIIRGAAAMYDAALNKAATNHGVTVFTNRNCLYNGCILGISTKPSVHIFISSDAAEKTDIKFASAFSMMITKK